MKPNAVHAQEPLVLTLSSVTPHLLTSELLRNQEYVFTSCLMLRKHTCGLRGTKDVVYTHFSTAAQTLQALKAPRACPPISKVGRKLQHSKV